MSGPRRSSRANKGQHSRDALDLYYEPDSESVEIELHETKRRKILSDEASDDEFQPSTTTDLEHNPALKPLQSVFEKDLISPAEDRSSQAEMADPKEEVRCDPCGTTSANYDEASDNGGIMIECEACQTWQHARCMGYRYQKAIPKSYTCNRCPAKPTPKDKTRVSVCKALYNVVLKNKDAGGLATDEDARVLADRMEDAIYEWSGTTDKKYIDKSRSVMALVKKPAVLVRAALGSLAMTSLVLLPPEEIDAELKNYAEKVRQELIRRLVLTVEDDAGQRIRRTHKGEEVVETSNSHSDDAYNEAVVGRRVDHRNFDKEPSPSVIGPASLGPNIYLLHTDDDEDAVDGEAETLKPASSRNNEAEDSDEELDFILNRKSPVPAVAPNPEPVLPPIMPKKFWSGTVVFPDFASFEASAEFVGCTKYQQPKDVATANFHNRAMRVCKDLMERPKYLIEGRLDRARADPYLSQIVSSRDLFLVQLVDAASNPDFEKLFEYLLSRSKVGVLSNRASFVKDSYVFAVDGNVPLYMDFGPLSRGLYALFVVKKDYVPVGRSILKKTVSPQPAAAVNNLDSILSKLESNPSSHTSAPFINHTLNSAHLNSQQVQYLTELVNQNPHAQNNSQALLSLIQNNPSSPFH